MMPSKDLHCRFGVSDADQKLLSFVLACLGRMHNGFPTSLFMPERKSSE